MPVDPNHLRIRSFEVGDEPGVKSALREAAFSHIQPGIITSVRTTAFKIITASAAALTFACSGSLLYCLATICFIILVVCASHATAAVYYVFGPPLKDLNDIVAIYQKSSNSHFWIAEASWESDRKTITEVIGTIAIVQKSDAEQKIAFLRRMSVRQSFRRMGIARRLLDTAVGFCRLHGYERIELITTDIHKAAMQLYVNSGFQCTKYEPRRYIHGIISVWTYQYEFKL